jgi:hypothetical protein
MSTKKSSRKSFDAHFDAYKNLYKVSFADASDEVKAFLAFTELKTTQFQDAFEAFSSLSKEARDEYLNIQVKRYYAALSS